METNARQDIKKYMHDHSYIETIIDYIKAPGLSSCKVRKVKIQKYAKNDN